MPKIIIYSTPDCHFCLSVKKFIEEKGFEYEERNVYENADYVDEMIKKSNQMGVPVIDIDGEIIVGFNRPRLEEILAEKRTA